jgi:alanyl-tRNA synthetase
MSSSELRRLFLEFFRQKEHEIFPSAPMVIKNDPTLMFTNAGMNQFKDIFLGNIQPVASRVANAQKCLRVSGKHNDLEEVGHDTYHHTMFEMLGNWSFGDYFKKEAIAWAHEFLTSVVKIPADRLYATVFEGSRAEKLEMDKEALDHWKTLMPPDHILTGSKKDNFWEMGDTGPCGPCSEIHIDLRPDAERKRTPGSQLVNQDHPSVMEIWNLVFIQYNRKKDGSLEMLPQKHVDTGMGFERLCMVVQQKKSNYDIDIFKPVIDEISYITGIKYGAGRKTDVAMRVVADHLRAIAFSIADGQLPSNTKAGYVIRRILRRAVRYSFTFLKQSEPFIYRLIPVLNEKMGDAYPELKKHQPLIQNVIREEESSFLRTLETGLRLLDQIMKKAGKEKTTHISGKTAFELYDTYGFPLDLTELILREKNMTVNMDEFTREMEVQKNRSRNAAATETGEWVEILPLKPTRFIGYDTLSAEVKILRYRKVKAKGEIMIHAILDKTPFYAEAGGQVGDSGFLNAAGERIEVTDTRQENQQVIHILRKLPSNPAITMMATVSQEARIRTANNHTATHLLHHALREVLGKHVEQKGSLVHPDYLRFDFSHFQKMSDEELSRVESLVNKAIRENKEKEEKRHIPIKEAKKMGAMSLFGEKYGETARVIRFGDSIELCGGTHVDATGQIGIFKITSESAVAAGIRRIEAVTAEKAEEYINEKINSLKQISLLLKNPPDPVTALERLFEENAELLKQKEERQKEGLQSIKQDLLKKATVIHSVNVITEIVGVAHADHLRDLCFQMRNEIPDLFMLLGTVIEDKAHLALMISDNLVKVKGWNAGQMIRKIAAEIQGGGGGQPFFATAGGKNTEGLGKALEEARKMIG